MEHPPNQKLQELHDTTITDGSGRHWPVVCPNGLGCGPGGGPEPVTEMCQPVGAVLCNGCYTGPTSTRAVVRGTSDVVSLGKTSNGRTVDSEHPGDSSTTPSGLEHANSSIHLRLRQTWHPEEVCFCLYDGVFL